MIYDTLPCDLAVGHIPIIRFIRTYPRSEGWEGSLRQIADLVASKGDLAHKET